MIVLHAIWDSVVSGRLHLWAESSTMPGVAAKQGRRGKGTEEKPQTHPFALPYSGLREVVGELGAGLSAKDASLDALTLRLPSTTKGPRASPELIREDEEAAQEVTGFRAWDVETLTLDAGDALDFLLNVPDSVPRGMAYGSGLRFWIIAARVASELIVGQSYLPALQETKVGRSTIYRAAWQVVLSDDDTERVRQLAKLMPPVCWSYLPLGDKQASLPRGILMHFLNQMVDAFVRGSLNAGDIVPVKRRQQTSVVPPVERWLAALTADDTMVSGTASEMRAFAQTVQTWLGQLALKEADSSFRTCFRLDQPSSEDESSNDGATGTNDTNEPLWHVSFHLQAKDDRSLLVPAEEVWRERSGTLTFLKRKFENPQERLLADLGKASRLFPALEESLRTARPDKLTLDTEQAYQFLRQSAPLLEQSGFGVLVPPWWNKASAKPRVKLKIKGKSGVASNGLLSLDGIVAYDWTVSIGDTTLSAKEFEKLVNLKMPLIEVRGQWVELRPEEIEAAIAFFKKKQRTGTMTFGEALRLGLGQDTADIGLPVDGIEGEGWIQDILDKLSGHATIEAIPQPETLNGLLRPYQLKGVSWLSFLQQFGFGACLADDMGLGKCSAPDTQILVNGLSQKAENIWQRYAGDTIFDGEGYWTEPKGQLLTNSIDEQTGKIVQAPIKRLYRQQVHTHLRKVKLEDGNSITITYPHKLLTNRGWTNNLQVGDYVGVLAKESADELQRLIDQEVFYCKIKEIEDVEYEGWVYDFEVEKHHNFVANNILCHNTVQLISLLLHEQDKKAQNVEHTPNLLICPMSIVGNWQRELQRFAPSLRVMVHHGAERLSGEAFVEEVGKHDVVITTYALALRDKEHLSAIDWQYLAVDEAQNIKNDEAKQTRAIKSIPAAHRVALTGTPVENRLSELWSIMEFLNPGYLGSATDFRKSFAVPIERYHDKERGEMLKQLIQPFVLRRVKTDKTIIQDLPDKMEMKVFCNLTQEQASLYEAVVKEMMKKIEESEGIERRGLILSTLMKLKQICNHPAQFVSDGSSLEGRSGKLERLEEMLEEVLAEGDKALIFTQFAEMGGLLRSYLQERLGHEVMFLHGGTPKKQRDAMVQRFQEERGSAPLFILSLKAGGVGLNLTGANHVFHFDRWWNPAVENQATDRAFRIGQQKNVQVHKFVCVGTLEERIDQMIEQKKALAENIVGSGENWLTEMSTSQLKELFALSREAVGV